MNIESQVLADILMDNLGQRLTHATATGIVAVFNQEMARRANQVTADSSVASQEVPD